MNEKMLLNFITCQFYKLFTKNFEIEIQMILKSVKYRIINIKMYTIFEKFIILH